MMTCLMAFYCISVLMAGLLPFVMGLPNLHFILKSVCEEHSYYPFGKLFWELLALLIVDSEIAMIFTYLRLCKEVIYVDNLNGNGRICNVHFPYIELSLVVEFVFCFGS